MGLGDPEEGEPSASLRSEGCSGVPTRVWGTQEKELRSSVGLRNVAWVPLGSEFEKGGLEIPLMYRRVRTGVPRRGWNSPQRGGRTPPHSIHSTLAIPAGVQRHRTGDTLEFNKKGAGVPLAIQRSRKASTEAEKGNQWLRDTMESRKGGLGTPLGLRKRTQSPKLRLSHRGCGLHCGSETRGSEGNWNRKGL
jgi:hypothetical protein